MFLGVLQRCSSLRGSRAVMCATTGVRREVIGFERGFSTYSEDPELEEFLEYLENLKNYEKSGVPKGAGTDSSDGFDLGRMNRLMERLGNPQSSFKVWAQILFVLYPDKFFYIFLETITEQFNANLLECWFAAKLIEPRHNPGGVEVMIV